MPKWIKWEDFIKQEEEAQERACIECASSNGHTLEMALGCEDGDGNLNCQGCPWGEKL